MDIFATGCVLAELFADGEPLFDYSHLLAFRRGDYDPGPAIEALDNPGIAAVVAHMTQRDPSSRLSAAEYIDMYTEAVVVDQGVVQAVRPFMATALGLEADRRAEVVAAGYPELKKKLLKKGETEEESGKIERSRSNERLRDESSFGGSGIDAPIAEESIEGEEPGPNTQEELGSESFVASQLHAHATALLAHARGAIAALGDRSGIGSNAAAAVGGKTTNTNNIIANSAVSSPAQSRPSSALQTRPSDELFLNPTGVSDGMVVTLALLCAVLRGSRRQSVRVLLVEQVCDCAVGCGDDEARLQRAVPQLVAAATDPQFAAVRCAALRALPRVLACVAKVPPGDTRAFADYLLPSLSLLPADGEPSVQAAYAGVLGAVALAARGALERGEDGGTGRYDEELGRLRGAVERAVHDLLVGSRSEPKLALLPHLGDLAAVLGRRDTADGLLPALLTLFNSREWEVRAELYAQLAGVCPALGPQGVAFLLPFLDRMLSDPEPAAVAAAAALLAALCRARLLQQRHVLAAAAKVVEAGLLKSECTAARAAAVEFVAAAAQTLPRAAGQALLLPLLQPHLARDPAPLDAPSAVAAALQPKSFKRNITTKQAPHRSSSSRPSSSASHGTLTLMPPSTSYSVMLDPRHLRRGASWLSAALQQAAHEAGVNNGTASGNIPLLVATAQRNVARSVVPGLDVDSAVQPAVQPGSRSFRRTSPGPAASVAATPQQISGAAAKAQPWRPRGVLVAHLAEHKRQVTRLASVPGTSLFISTSEDGTAKVWDARRLERDISFRPRASYEGHGGAGVRAAAALSDGSSVITGGSDGSVHLWKVERGGQGDGWAVNGATQMRQHSPKAGPVMDLCAWGPDVVVVSSAGMGVTAIDTRTPPGTHPSWRLPCPPSRGVVSRLCCDNASSSSPLYWIVTGTSRGAMALWDVRFVLPVTSWAHPKGAGVDAMALSSMPSTTGAPVVYVAAGKDEVAAWDTGNGTVKSVLRLAGKDALGAVPEALAAPALELGGVGDPLARARQLGATELRTLAARRPGFRSLLSGPGSELLSGGSDCAVRCWDVVDPQRSYVVVAPPQDAYVVPKWSYSSRVVGQASVIEERAVEGIASQRRGAVREDAAAVEERQVGARWWERAVALGHQQSIVDMARMEGHAEPLLASASLDGVIKVWR